MDSRDEIKAVVQIAETQQQFLAGFLKLMDVLERMAATMDGMANSLDSAAISLGAMNVKLDRMAVSLNGLDQSVKLIQEVMNNPTDDVPVGMVVKPNPGKPNAPSP
jgi:hypothetical protein